MQQSMIYFPYRHLFRYMFSRVPWILCSLLLFSASSTEVLGDQKPAKAEVALDLQEGTHTIEVWATFDNSLTMLRIPLDGRSSPEEAEKAFLNHPDIGRIKKQFAANGAEVLKTFTPNSKTGPTKIISETFKAGTYYWKIGVCYVTYRMGGGASDTSEDDGSEESQIEDSDVLKTLIGHLLPDLERANVFFTGMMADSTEFARLKGVGSGFTAIAKFTQTQQDAINRISKARQLLKANAKLGEDGIEKIFGDIQEIINNAETQYNKIDEGSRTRFEKATGLKIASATWTDKLNQMSGVNMSKKARAMRTRASEWGKIAKSGESRSEVSTNVAGVYNAGEYAKMRLDNDGRVYEATGVVEGKPPVWHDTQQKWIFKSEVLTKDGKEILVEEIILLEDGKEYNSYKRHSDGSFRTRNPANPPLTRKGFRESPGL